MKRDGFSLLELLVVMAVAMVIMGMALPSMTNAIANARMRGSLTSLSGLLQNTRMFAVKDNKTKITCFTVRSNGLIGYIKDATDCSSSSPSTKDYQIEMEAPISKLTTPSGAGAPTAITADVLGYTPQTGDVSFNSRGLPCSYSSGTCTNYGFIYYFKDTRISGSGGWAAISVSPAGRVNRWFWSGAAWTS